MRKICSSGNTKVSTSLEGIASATDESVNHRGVFLGVACRSRASHTTAL